MTKNVVLSVSGQLHALAILPMGKAYFFPSEQEAGWAPETVWTQV